MLIGRRDAARILGVSPHRVDRLRRDGRSGRSKSSTDLYTPGGCLTLGSRFSGVLHQDDLSELVSNLEHALNCSLRAHGGSSGTRRGATAP
jgi:hypothetical protein